MAWTEATIGHTLARNTFKAGLVLVPNTSWTGHECDLLVLTERLFIVDVEAKISRADFRADAKKDKWWHRDFWRYGQAEPPRVHRDWPPKVWKHYYAMPRAIWRPDMFDMAASPASGIILLGDDRYPEAFSAEVVRRAKPNPEAKACTAGQVQEIARLASLRMWDALRARDRETSTNDETRTK